MAIATVLLFYIASLAGVQKEEEGEGRDSGRGREREERDSRSVGGLKVVAEGWRWVMGGGDRLAEGYRWRRWVGGGL
jgi:hypothetical protein